MGSRVAGAILLSSNSLCIVSYRQCLVLYVKELLDFISIFYYSFEGIAAVYTHHAAMLRALLCIRPGVPHLVTY